MQRVQRSTLLTALVAGCALAGAANAQVIRITNVNGSTGHDIPLKANSSVQIDSAGNLLAECALNSSNVCTALSTGGGTSNPNAPTASLTRADSDSDVRTGETVRLAWSSTSAEACKVSTAGPAATSFTGVRGVDSATGEVVTVSAAGSYTFSIVCYNGAGGSTASTQVVAVAAADTQQPPPDNNQGACTIQTTDPNFNPVGFTKVEKEWHQVFSAPDGSPQALYPSGVSFPTPVGATKGTYVVIPFVPNVNQSVNLYWDQVQSRPQDGYSLPRPAANMFFAISPCKGDLRSWSNVGNDLFLRGGCRKMANGASLVWSSGPLISATSDAACKLDAGTTYYLHISPVDPSDGLTPGEHTCENVTNSASGCDVGVVLSNGPG